MKILGVNTGHDSIAALIADGNVVAAVDEERFTRNKHCGDPPILSIKYCLDMANNKIDEIAISSDLLGRQVFNFFDLDTALSKKMTVNLAL